MAPLLRVRLAEQSSHVLSPLVQVRVRARVRVRVRLRLRVRIRQSRAATCSDSPLMHVAAHAPTCALTPALAPSPGCGVPWRLMPPKLPSP